MGKNTLSANYLVDGKNAFVAPAFYNNSNGTKNAALGVGAG